MNNPGLPEAHGFPKQDAAPTPVPATGFRTRLTVVEDVVEDVTWSGAVPVAHGVAPLVRVGRGRWFNPLWLLPIGFVTLIVGCGPIEALSSGHGAPLRPRNETQPRFKQVKWIRGVEFVTHFSEVGGGYGGYNQDH